MIPFLASLVAEDLSPKTVDGYRLDLLAFRRWYRESRGTDLRWETLRANNPIHDRQHVMKDPENGATRGRGGLGTSRPSISTGLFTLETAESFPLGRITFNRPVHYVPGLLPLSEIPRDRSGVRSFRRAA